MARIIDLKDLIDLDRVVITVDGEPYTLPGDLPVPEFLRLRHRFNLMVSDDEPAEEFDADETLGEMHEQLLGMFQVHHPDLTELPFGSKGVIPVVFAYLNQNMGEIAEDPVPPTKPASTRKRTSGNPRSRTKTPSR